jgi:hypothetical protein
MGMGMKFEYFFEFVWTCNNKKWLVFKFKCLNLNLNKTHGQIRARRLAIPTVRYRPGRLRDYSSAGRVGLHVTIPEWYRHCSPSVPTVTRAVWGSVGTSLTMLEWSEVSEHSTFQSLSNHIYRGIETFTTSHNRNLLQ